MHTRLMLSLLVLAVVVATEDADANNARLRADAMTWPVPATVSTEPDVPMVAAAPDPTMRSEHADAITWECPRSLALTH